MSSVARLGSSDQAEYQRNRELSAAYSYPHSDSEGSDDEADQDATTSARQTSRMRTGSIAQRFNNLLQYGGVNSFENFAQSWQRAGHYREIIPNRRGSVIHHIAAEDADVFDQEHIQPSSLQDGPSHLSNGRRSSSFGETSALLQSGLDRFARRSSTRPRANETIFGTSYGSTAPSLTERAERRASILADQRVRITKQPRRPSAVASNVPKPRIEITEQKGELIAKVVGDSTVPMTGFNTINALVGVAMLSLPLALSQAGWVIGLLLFTAVALATNYTARLLARCLDTSVGSMTYGDIAFLAFGSWGRGCIETIFLIELIFGSTSMIILFADSMHQLVPSVTIRIWQVVIALGLLPLNFAPMKFLSLTSILGVFCTVGIVILVFTDGLIKPTQPGSLRIVAETSAWPKSLTFLPLSIGLLVAPWGGHAVIPAVYRDMRHPHKFPRIMHISYGVSYLLDLCMAVVGYLMFGHTVENEVTAGILGSNAYPPALSYLIISFIAILSTTKLPLLNRPIMDTMAAKLSTNPTTDDNSTNTSSDTSPSESDPLTQPGPSFLKAHSPNRKKTGRYAAAILSNLIELSIAILFPSFDRMMALLGSFFCFTICIILPIAFYLRIFGDSVDLGWRVACWVFMGVCSALAVLGTVWAVLPMEVVDG